MKVLHYPSIIIRGKRKGQFKDKTIREYCLNDVLKLKDHDKSNNEIHDHLCEKYGFIDENPVEKRYLGYIKANNL